MKKLVTLLLCFSLAMATTTIAPAKDFQCHKHDTEKQISYVQDATTIVTLNYHVVDNKLVCELSKAETIQSENITVTPVASVNYTYEIHKGNNWNITSYCNSHYTKYNKRTVFVPLYQVLITV